MSFPSFWNDNQCASVYGFSISAHHCWPQESGKIHKGSPAFSFRCQSLLEPAWACFELWEFNQVLVHADVHFFDDSINAPSLTIAHALPFTLLPSHVHSPSTESSAPTVAFSFNIQVYVSVSTPSKRKFPSLPAKLFIIGRRPGFC